MKEMLEAANRIHQAGGTLYLVGGTIRNELLNLPVTDEDYCVTGISKEQFKNLFPEAKITGKDFPVFILNQKEIALARKERKVGQGHKKFEFDTNSDITIRQDLARRDLTINSIAKDVLTGEMIDPYNGREDIQNEILRKTTDAFTEDPLRAYRVARFAATLQFEVEPDTILDMKQLKPELFTLSKERVFTEFKKALESEKPSTFFEVLKKAEILEVHFQEIAQLIGKIQPKKYHPEGDSYIHTMMVVDKSCKLTQDTKVRFSCLAHDFGKGITPKEILPHHYGHDEKGLELVQKLGNRIGLPNEWIKYGKVATKWHMKAGIFDQMTSKKKVELIEQVDKSILGLGGLKVVVACDKNREPEELQETYNKIQFDSLGKKCLEVIDGNFIQKKYPNLEGKLLGEKLHEERINWVKMIDRK